MDGTDLFIDDTRALAKLLDSISDEEILALDTEFVRERTYYPKLCLVQIATSDVAACVDCLADMPLEPLFDSILADRTWLLHSARQDLEVLQRHTTKLPSRLIDTQIAAGLLGCAPQIGLGDLLSDVLGVKLDKAYARTNWAKRPLPEAAVHYALDDVRYLPTLWQKLIRELDQRERLAWLEEDCASALSTPPVTPTATLWSRLKGVGSLNDNARCASLALVEWRETCAQTLDRPRRWVLADDVLLRVAAAEPTDRKALAAVPEMPPRLVERFGDEILGAIAASRTPANMARVRERMEKPRPDKNGLKLLQERARARAQELGIEPEVLATRKELIDILTGATTDGGNTGWRREELRNLI